MPIKLCKILFFRGTLYEEVGSGLNRLTENFKKCTLYKSDSIKVNRVGVV